MAKPKSLKAVEGTPEVAEVNTVPAPEVALPAAPAVKPEVRSREEIFAGIVVESY